MARGDRWGRWKVRLSMSPWVVEVESMIEKSVGGRHGGSRVV